MSSAGLMLAIISTSHYQMPPSCVSSTLSAVYPYKEVTFICKIDNITYLTLVTIAIIWRDSQKCITFFIKKHHYITTL